MHFVFLHFLLGVLPLFVSVGEIECSTQRGGFKDIRVMQTNAIFDDTEYDSDDDQLEGEINDNDQLSSPTD